MIGELNETRASIISLFVNEKEIKKSPQTHLMIFNIRSSINHIEVLISISSKLEIVIRQICLYFTERNRSNSGNKPGKMILSLAGCLYFAHVLEYRWHSGIFFY